jgi:hypothetical protein
MTATAEQVSTIEERRADAAEQARDAFWQTFAAQFPEAEDGHLAPDELMAFDRAIEEVTQAWLANNLPKPDVGKRGMFEGTKIQFYKGAFKSIENWELDISGKTGVVLCAGPGALEVQLDEHVPELDQWENTVIWTIEDCLFGDRLDCWDDVTPEQAYGFFAGYLAAMVVA